MATIPATVPRTKPALPRSWAMVKIVRTLSALLISKVAALWNRLCTIKSTLFGYAWSGSEGLYKNLAYEESRFCKKVSFELRWVVLVNTWFCNRSCRHPFCHAEWGKEIESAGRNAPNKKDQQILQSKCYFSVERNQQPSSVEHKFKIKFLFTRKLMKPISSWDKS